MFVVVNDAVPTRVEYPYETIEYTNKIDHDTIFVRFHTIFSNGKTQI